MTRFDKLFLDVAVERPPWIPATIEGIEHIGPGILYRPDDAGAVSQETRMTHATRFVPAVAVLIALALCVPVQTQTPEIDALRARAEAGDVETQYNFGNMYALGLGVFPQDDAEAVRWYRLAADQGYASAQYNLGLIYGTGRGVPQDDVQAHMWFNLAASRLTSDLDAGVDTSVADDLSEARERAVQGRDVAEGRMTPDGLNEAERRARE